MRTIVFELCAETVDACVAASAGGASRVELCSGLSEGGLTPSHGLIAGAVQACGLPVHVMIRPRGGDFRYNETDFAVMQEDVRQARFLGAAGVVLGVLTAQSTVDLERTRELVALAGPMQVTFHRAFDETTSLPGALEDVIQAGCGRVLTSGGQKDVLTGTAMLRALVVQAQGRIDVTAGGGLRLASAGAVARLTGAEHFHGSLRSRRTDGTYTVDAEAVRTMVACLGEG